MTLAEAIKKTTAAIEGYRKAEEDASSYTLKATIVCGEEQLFYAKVEKTDVQDKVIYRIIDGKVITSTAFESNDWHVFISARVSHEGETFIRADGSKEKYK